MYFLRLKTFYPYQGLISYLLLKANLHFSESFAASSVYCICMIRESVGKIRIPLCLCQQITIYFLCLDNVCMHTYACCYSSSCSTILLKLFGLEYELNVLRASMDNLVEKVFKCNCEFPTTSCRIGYHMSGLQLILSLGPIIDKKYGASNIKLELYLKDFLFRWLRQD